MKVTPTAIEAVMIFEPRRFADARGYFVERYNKKTWANAGLDCDFVQDNQSRSVAGVLRGLHYQYQPTQGKLVSCVQGRIWDVAVDLRWDQPTFGQHVAVELSEDNGLQLWIPAGFAHGFCVLGDKPADVIYKVDHLYNAQGEAALHWADPELKIEWPLENPMLSGKDQAATSFAIYKSSPLAQQKWWLS